MAANLLIRNNRHQSVFFWFTDDYDTLVTSVRQSYLNDWSSQMYNICLMNIYKNSKTNTTPTVKLQSKILHHKHINLQLMNI